MKKNLLILFVFACLFNSIAQIRTERFEIFGAKFKAKEITGSKNFNDIGLFYETKGTFNNFTDRLDSYRSLLGTVRIDSKNFKEGTFQLFDLSDADKAAGFTILDQIDFEYYTEFGFKILDTSKTLIKDAKYIALRTFLIDPNKTNLVKRNKLWELDNMKYRHLLADTKYFINVQPVIFSRKQVKKMSTTLKLKAKADISKVLEGYFKAFTASGGKIKMEDTLGLTATLTTLINKTFEVKGEYLSIKYTNEYISKIVEVLGNNPDTNGNDLFSKNLKKYLTDSNQTEYAINAGLFAFRFAGNFKRSSVSKASIETLLSTNLNITNTVVVQVALAVTNTYNVETEETLSNQFNKMWIIKFASDKRLDLSPAIQEKREKYYKK